MTTHYFEYRIELSDSERGEIAHILSRLWQRLHGVLSTEKLNSVGVSLPEMRSHFAGRILRLHSDEATLLGVAENAGLVNALEIFPLVVGGVSAVPAYHDVACFKRFRTPEKLTDAWIIRTEERWIKRAEKRGESITTQQLLERRKALKEKGKQPFIDPESGDIEFFLKMRSQSTQQRFSLNVIKRSVEVAVPGQFSFYGLAMNESTVPIFE